ncbi:MFS transporter [Fluoribacter dumoffii]|uniref:Arabinose efflux permease n=1 Tax=Fluoribacter dumoffii TaxID=463 RepID=A0A377GBK0_9GAMM|nr:MFS transporter [Fluoribacter dumoffii]KTC90518.1 major facilitator superfamily (MFS) transporter [Fluoribacter dumoffii NY 23]MCW8386197.1 MFS transporter [Fluoribacter dumoffii]MCW8419248.1 MFS transporter [Fluoribacter dumoffii]MCW8452877.1 MFS transporter [Fluoribacter dumoffii]MCW8459873.1 MFS transporter [Fluoribacter dumoffii]
MSTSRVIAWFVWIIASIFYAYQYILRVMPSIMMNDITAQFHIDATVFGQFSGVYYLGYSLMHLPIGILLDRFGPRKIMTLCILLPVVGLLPLLFSEHWVYPLMGRALIGIGSSAAILGTFKIIRMTFKEQHFSRMLSFSVMIGLIGAVYGGGPVSYMCQAMGYKMVIELFIVIGLVLACVTYLIVPDEKPTYHTSVIANIKTVFGNKKVILLCCFAGLMLGPLEGFSDVWGAGFLKQVYGLNSATANYLPSMIFLGMCFGSPILSLIAEKTGYYLGTIIAAGITMCLVFTALVAGILTVSSITVSFIIVGMCCAYQILAIYIVSTYVPENLAGLTTAIANMIIMIFGYGFHTVIGYLINEHGGIREAGAFVYGIGVIPATLAMGVIGFSIIAYREKYALSKYLPAGSPG